MTVQSNNPVVNYTGNGVTTSFNAPANCISPPLVILTDNTIPAAPVVQTLVLNSDYTLDNAGGVYTTIHMVVPPKNLVQVLTAELNEPFTQLTHWVEGDPFPAASHEAAADHSILLAQQLQGRIQALATPGLTIAQILAPLASPAAGQGPALIPGLPFTTVLGADPTGATDSSAVIQTALNTGKSLILPPGTYKANNLTMATSYQRLIALGAVTIQKNANGPLITISGQYECELDGVKFMGDATTPVFTGDNIVVTAAVQTVRIHNCGSTWAYGRALKSYAGRTEVIGSNPIWQTADTTGTGYDLEIGVSGTATLYHLLHGIVSSQATGGILMTDTGASSIIGCQIGKLNAALGSGASGSGGNKFVGNRIKGALTIDQSNCVFTGNEIDAVAVVITANAASGVVLDESNVWANGATIANSGSAANIVRKAVSVAGYQAVRYGDDTWTPTLQVAPGGPVWWGATAFCLDNNKGYLQRRNDGTAFSTVLNLNATGLYLGDGLATGANSVSINSGVLINFNASAATQWQMDGSNFYPTTDNAQTLGKASHQTKQVWSYWYNTVLGGVQASGATLAVSGTVMHISGTSAISLITLPYTGFIGTITVIPDGAFTLATGGVQAANNYPIGLASTAAIGKVMILAFDGTKWWPSY